MIKITDITPFMKKGWVAMDKDGCWCWYEKKPKICKGDKMWNNPNWGDCYEIDFYIFKDIAPADDWTQSLIKVGGNDETMA